MTKFDDTIPDYEGMCDKCFYDACEADKKRDNPVWARHMKKIRLSKKVRKQLAKSQL